MKKRGTITIEYDDDMTTLTDIAETIPDAIEDMVTVVSCEYADTGVVVSYENPTEAVE